MQTVRMTVASVEAPQFGKKRGRIKDTDGKVYQALPNFLNMVAMGSSYDLTYKDDSFNGANFRVVEGITPALGASPVAPQPTYASPPSQAPSRPPQRYEPDTAPRDDRGDDIATLAIAKVWLERVEVGDEAGCLHALRVARRAWKKFKANPDNIESGNQGYRPISDAEFPE